MRNQGKLSSQLFLASSLMLPAIGFAIDSYDPVTGVVHMPVVSVGAETFDVYMQHQGDLIFQVTVADPVLATSASPDMYDSNEGTLYIPGIVIGDDTFEVYMQHQGDLVFNVVSADLVTASDSSGTNTSGIELNNTIWFNCSRTGLMARTYYKDNKFAYTLEYYNNDSCTGTPMMEEVYLIGGDGDGFDKNNIKWTGDVEIGESFISVSGVEATRISFKYYDIEKYGIFSIQGDTVYRGISLGVFDETKQEVELDFDKVWKTTNF